MFQTDYINKGSHKHKAPDKIVMTARKLTFKLTWIQKGQIRSVDVAIDFPVFWPQS